MKNFVVYGFGQAVNLISPLLITPYLIYTCGIEKLGVIAIGQALAYILIVFVDYSSYIVGVKEISINRNDHSKLQELFNTIYAAKAILLFFVGLISILFIYSIPYFTNYASSLLFSLTIVFGQFINPTWFFQGVENFKWITIINVLSKLLYVGGVLLFVHTANDYVYANLWLGLGAILANLIGLFYILKTFGFSLRQFSNSAVKTLLVRDFSFCVSQFFFAVRNYSAVMIIGFFAGDFVAGKFKVIEQIINLLRTYLQMFFKFSYSYVCFEVDQNLQKGLQLWRKYNLLNYLFLLAIVFTLYLFSAQTLRFFRVDDALVPTFESYLKLALFIPLLIGITLPLEQLLFSLNQNKVYIRLTIGTTVLNTLLVSIAMKFFELTQVFIFLIATELALIICYYLVLRPSFQQIKKIKIQ
jgi:O-antigen/teichoic acid export membrane protein